MTISFAGSPSKNAVNTVPSSPRNLPIGSKNSQIIERTDRPSTEIFAESQITAPVGAATHIARARTFNVLSSRDRTIIFFICGFRNGGISRMNDELFPFNTVFESIFEIISVINIPINTKAVSISAETTEEKNVPSEAKNIAIIAINVGNLPLHGTKLFVSVAISRSLGESIILQPTTAAALHPKPMHIVSACFPQEPHLLKHLSRLKAILGR